MRVNSRQAKTVAISAKGHQNAFNTPMGIPPFYRARYCAGSWGRLPSNMAGSIFQIVNAKLQHK
jgi:hypothetical protein